jgi:putative spermidine/putrescine transport system substrate-binding protein
MQRSRAKALDRIKPYVVNWYTASRQSVNLVTRGECDFTHGYASWVQNAVADGAKLSISSGNNLIGVNWIGIPKGSRKKAEAMKFIDFMLRPDRQAEFVKAVKYAPAVSVALDLVSPEIRAAVPDVNSPSNCILNLDWWNGKEEALTQRFKEWLIS